jgi:hypothetical protein
VVTNVFIISGFFFAALAAYWLLRTFQLAPVWAALGGLVFAFLPYHFIRLFPLNHLYLANYWTVPFAVWLALKAWPDPAHEAAPFRSMRIGLAAALVAVGTSGIYYAFFACFLVASAGLASTLSRRVPRACRRAGAGGPALRHHEIRFAHGRVSAAERHDSRQGRRDGPRRRDGHRGVRLKPRG